MSLGIMQSYKKEEVNLIASSAAFLRSQQQPPEQPQRQTHQLQFALPCALLLLQWHQ